MATMPKVVAIAIFLSTANAFSPNKMIPIPFCAAMKTDANAKKRSQCARQLCSPARAISRPDGTILQSGAASTDSASAARIQAVQSYVYQSESDEWSYLLEGDRARRQLRTRLLQFGLSMILAASAATGETTFFSCTISAFVLAYAVHRFFTVEGMYKSGIDCAGLPESTYEIRDSSGRGKGLFAAKPIKAGDFMMYYDGERVDEFEVLRRYGSDPNSDAAGYVMTVTDNEYIDASDPEACKFGRPGQPGHLARYMNHAPKSHPRRNVDKYVARRPGGFVSFFAARDIAPGSNLTVQTGWDSAGEELCYVYGPHYWTAKDIEPV